MSDRLIFFLGTPSFKATQFQSYSSSETQVREKRRDKSFQAPADSVTRLFPNGQANAAWLPIGHILLLPIGQQYPPSYFRVFGQDGHFFAILAKKCTQSGNFQFDKDTVHFKILSSRKLKHGTVCNGILKTLLQKYKLELTTSLHRSHLCKYLLRYLVIGQKKNFLGANWSGPAGIIRNVFLSHR